MGKNMACISQNSDFSFSYVFIWRSLAEYLQPSLEVQKQQYPNPGLSEAEDL